MRETRDFAFFNRDVLLMIKGTQTLGDLNRLLKQIPLPMDLIKATPLLSTNRENQKGQVFNKSWI